MKRGVVYAQLATSQMSAVLQLASMLNYEAQNDTNLLRGGGGVANDC